MTKKILKKRTCSVHMRLVLAFVLTFVLALVYALLSTYIMPMNSEAFSGITQVNSGNNVGNGVMGVMGEKGVYGVNGVFGAHGASSVNDVWYDWESLAEWCEANYRVAEEYGDYVGMNRARRNAARLRQSNSAYTDGYADGYVDGYEDGYVNYYGDGHADNYAGIYEDDYDYTHGGAIYTYSFSAKITEGGRSFSSVHYIYVLSGVSAEQADMQSINEKSGYVAIDDRNRKHPNIQVRNSHKAVGDTEVMVGVIEALLQHEASYPSKWIRDSEGMLDEWRWHNLAFALGYQRERTGHVDFDNCDWQNYPRSDPHVGESKDHTHCV